MLCYMTFKENGFTKVYFFQVTNKKTNQIPTSALSHKSLKIYRPSEP